ncbi:hypothetical protein M8542_42230 [Amycolatopsis sp. OK19-0408]|uniref:Uncharacterized protein n=1 Tax=Amycolatopsis iheyensis TaxID=2945988 RepID=A0A9X2NMA0_9PSEU|nr:hypothetical protein [Amycolatopsis iheyensis]MCR6489455.1 hypothetical protein [Amycolatopsis iheyensis]
MVTLTPRRMRIPGRKRFGGIFSGDTASFVFLFGFGFLFTAFFHVDGWRQSVYGSARVDFPAVLGLLTLCCAVGWRSLLRRGFVWVEPAELTWLDFAPVDRGRVVTLRLLGAWTGVVAVTGYLAALLLAVGGAGLDQWRAAVAVVVATAVVAFTSARRTSLRFDALGPLVLAVLGLVIAAAGLGPVTVEFGAAGVLVAALPLAFGGEPVTRAGRPALLAGWDGRVLRSVAVTFLDPMMLLPPAGPIGGVSLRRPTALRLAWAGTLGRSRYAGAAVLVGFAVVVAHIALPTLPGAVLVGIGAYVALMPFGAGLGELWRNPGRRRWLGSANRELVLTHGLVLAAVALAWTALLAAVTLAAGTTLGPGAWLAVPLSVLSILRTVTRTAVDYANPGFVDTPVGPMPANLTRQLFRGLDLQVIGIVVLSAAI